MTEDAPAANPVVADLANPVNVEATPLEPADEAATAAEATAGAAETAGETAVAVALPAATAIAGAATVDDSEDADVVEVNLPPAEPAVEVAASAAAAVELPAATSGPRFQIGVFSVEANAENAGSQLRSAGIPTSVVAQEAGGRVVWLVVSSPAEDDADADATLTRIKGAGFVDAVLIEVDS